MPTTDSSAASPYLEALAADAHPEGGWGYAAGQSPQLEPTCLALLALSRERDRFREAFDRGLALVTQAQATDGSFRLLKSREEAIWPTSLVLFALAALGETSPALGRAAGFLLNVRGRVPDNPEAGELHDIDVTLVGWPWAEKNFSWVEPTSWACLALRRVGQSSHERVQEGQRMLLDRAMDDGGINYGNRRILGKLTEPIPGPTALMLLALQGSDHPRVVAAVRYLLAQGATDDIDHLCWTRLALDLHRNVPGVAEALPQLDDAIIAAEQRRAEKPWARRNLVRQALVGLALGVRQGNPFRLSAEGVGPGVEPVASGASASTLPITTRVSNWLKGIAIKGVGRLRPLPVNSAVHIARAPSYDVDLAGILQEQYQHFKATVPLAGKRVVLKPNLVEYHRDKVINTNPLVVSAAIELCKREGAAEVVVAEGPGHWRNVEFLVAESGLGDVLKQHGVPFVDLNHDEPIKTPNLGQLTGLEYLYLTKTIATADVVISLPKLKTHHWAGATLSLKNLFGTLPGICYGWPKNELHWRGIDNSIVDIALTRTPELAIVDGIVGMEGDGPLNGTAKPMGVLVMGHDLVALDATCCRLMQLDPERIGYLVLGSQRKLGRLRESDIPQLGGAVADLAQPFETVPHLDGLRVRRSA